jgi:putative Mg2+ transporter-C (MgtC) family protein
MISQAEIVLRLVLAAVLGGIVGLEREIHGRPAGIRTYLILSVGAALIMVISEYYTVLYGLPPKWVSNDQGRIAAQAVTGIGFLGAGVILRAKDHVRGLTTAACVWTVCAIGLAIGAGFYLFGVLVTLLVVIALVVLKQMEKKLRKDWYKEITVISEDVPGQFASIQGIIEKHHVLITNFGLSQDLKKKEVTANFFLQGRGGPPEVHPSGELFQEIFALGGVKKVDLS